MITLARSLQPFSQNIPFAIFKHGATVSEAVSFLEKLHLKGMSRSTIRTYAYDLLCFYRFLDLSKISIADLKPKDGIGFLSALRKTGSAPLTINRRIIVIRSFLNSCKRRLGDTLFTTEQNSFYKGRRNNALLGPARIKGNLPACLRVKVFHKLRLPLDSATIRSLIGSLRSYRDQAIVALMLCSGLRATETLTLQVHDLDMPALQIRIWGKGNRERLIPITCRVRHTLEQYLKYERPDAVHTSCFVVLKGKRRGHPMSYEALRKIFRYRRKGRKDIHPHRLRHTFCTNMVRQGVSLPVIQKLMGHADIESTMNYINLSLEDVACEYHHAMDQLTKQYEEKN